MLLSLFYFCCTGATFLLCYLPLNTNLANGEISFFVVDGEPYVKVGADPARPFSNTKFIDYLVCPYSTKREYTFTEDISACVIICLSSCSSMSSITTANLINIAFENKNITSEMIYDNFGKVPMSYNGVGIYGWNSVTRIYKVKNIKKVILPFLIKIHRLVELQ